MVSDSGGATWPAVWATLATHNSRGHYLSLLWEKFKTAWHWYEIPDNSNFYFYRVYAPVLNQAVFTFFLLSPLSLVGLTLALPRLRSCWIPFFAVLMHLGWLLAFLPLSRYRLLLLATTLPFAGLAMSEVVRRFLAGQAFRGGLIVLATLSLMLWTGQALPAGMARARLVDAYAPYTHFYAPLVFAAQKNANWSEATGWVAKMLLSEPEVLVPWTAGDLLPNREARNAAEFYAFLHHKMASLLTLCAKPKEAAKHSARAASLDDAVRQFDAAGKRRRLGAVAVNSPHGGVTRGERTDQYPGMAPRFTPKLEARCPHRACFLPGWQNTLRRGNGPDASTEPQHTN